MIRTNLKAVTVGLLALAGTFLSSADARSDNSAVRGVYGNIPDNSIEFLSSGDHIKSVAASGAPMAIWEALEHGEKVECLDCIPAVENLLYDANARTREISAWWLRRRMFGVFGDGEVYQRTIQTLAGDGSALKRAYAAYALGEFLHTAGIAPVATALKGDADAGVRAAAAAALGRLNDDGGGALAAAFGDGDAGVKLAALKSSTRINAFSGIAQVASMLGDGDANVRRRTLEALDTFHAKDAIASVLSIAKNDPDAGVRAAACHALGTFGDASARDTLNAIAGGDASTLVRDMAQIALRKI
jgi:HEAT repeat protein